MKGTLPSFFWYSGRVVSVIGPAGAPKDFNCLARSPSDKAVTSNGRPPFTLLLITIFCGGLPGSFCNWIAHVVNDQGCIWELAACEVCQLLCQVLPATFIASDEWRYVEEMMFHRSHNRLLFTKLSLFKNLKKMLNDKTDGSGKQS